MDISTIIKELRLKKGIKQAELARLLDLNISTVSSYERGIRKPSKKVMIKLSNLFEISLEYLLRSSEEETFQKTYKYEDELFEIDTLLKKMGIKAETALEFMSSQVPIVGFAGAGSSVLALESIQEYLPAAEADFAVKVRGDSMEPIIADGSMALIKKIQISEFRNSDIGLVIVNQDKALLKRTYFTKEGVWLLSENKYYDPVFFTPEEWDGECMFLGKVVEIRILL